MSPPRPSNDDIAPGSPDLRHLQQYILSVREDVLLSLLDDPGITEAEILRLLNRRDLPSRIIEEIVSRPKWISSYRVKLAVSKNPRTPVKIGLGILKHLFLFDLVNVSLLPTLSRDLKELSESLILSQLPKLTLGEAMTLARRASGQIAEALLTAEHPQVVQGALDNPRLTYGSIIKALNLHACSPILVTMVSRHRKWKFNYDIRLALLRSPHLPTARALELINNIKGMDLEDLANDPKVALQFRQYLKRSASLARHHAAKPSQG